MIDPVARIDALLDVRVRDGLVYELGEHLSTDSDEEVIGADGAYVAPGFIDVHVHLREPGNPEKETIATGLAAAAAGGFTAVGAMPNTSPAIDEPKLVAWILERAHHAGLSRVYPIAAITRGRAGLQTVDYSGLHAAGAAAFSDDGSTIESAIVQTSAALQVRETGCALMTHCEVAALKQADEFNPAAEVAAVERDIAIAQATQARWHIAHVSTVGAIAAVENGKRQGVQITSEAAPHHLHFTHAQAADISSPVKVNPPLRSELDVEALRKAVRAGTIDLFASDHAPHVDDESPGFSGLEIAVGAYAAAVPELSVTRYVEMLSVKPAALLHVAGGTLQIGSPADVTIFADRQWTVEPASFYSKGKRTPFAGRKLPRRAIATIVGGVTIMREGRVLAGAIR